MSPCVKGANKSPLFRHGAARFENDFMNTYLMNRMVNKTRKAKSYNSGSTLSPEWLVTKVVSPSLTPRSRARRISQGISLDLRVESALLYLSRSAYRVESALLYLSRSAYRVESALLYLSRSAYRVESALLYLSRSAYRVESALLYLSGSESGVCFIVSL